MYAERRGRKRGIGFSCYIEACGLAPSQLAIARPDDLPRLRAIGTMLGTRNQAVPGMERAAGDRALLAMLADEAVALSVEGARGLVTRNVDAVPETLRISVRSLDEFYTELRAVGTYPSDGEAQRALGFVDQGLVGKILVQP